MPDLHTTDLVSVDDRRGESTRPMLARAYQPPARRDLPVAPDAPAIVPPSVRSGGSRHTSPAQASRARRLLRAMLIVGGILAAVLASGTVWLRGGRYASTDDAYVQAAKLMVSTDVSGIVSSVDVHEGQAVKKGDVLFRVDPRQFEIALANAKANLAETSLTLESMQQDYRRMLSDVAAQQAQVALDQTNYDRAENLVRANATARATYDQARYALAVDQSKLVSLQRQADVQLARLDGKPDLPVTQHPQYLQAKAKVDEAQRELDDTVVRAPFDGVVTQVDALQPGTYLVSQTAALTNTGAVALVSTSDVWVDANMKETDLTDVKRGDPVAVSIDTYPGHVWSGTVQSVSPASGSEFSILPAQNTSGNWVKVVQRIPVRVRIDRKSDPLPLRAGMSVTVSIDTGHRRTLSDLL
jgi:membrane fusion protein (multidrug efflux system)